MLIWYLLAAMSFVVGMAGTILANVYTTRMIDAINRARRDEPPISPLGFTPWKAVRVYRDYRFEIGWIVTVSLPDRSTPSRALGTSSVE